MIALHENDDGSTCSVQSPPGPPTSTARPIDALRRRPCGEAAGAPARPATRPHALGHESAAAARSPTREPICAAPLQSSRLQLIGVVEEPAEPADQLNRGVTRAQVTLHNASSSRIGGAALRRVESAVTMILAMGISFEKVGGSDNSWAGQMARPNRRDARSRGVSGARGGAEEPSGASTARPRGAGVERRQPDHQQGMRACGRWRDRGLDMFSNHINQYGQYQDAKRTVGRRRGDPRDTRLRRVARGRDGR